MKRKDRDDRGVQRHRRHRQGYRDAGWGSVGVELDRRSNAAIAPWLQTRRHQMLTAAYSVVANELASIGVFGGQPTRNRGPRSFARSSGLIYREHSLWRSSRWVRAGVLR